MIFRALHFLWNGQDTRDPILKQEVTEKERIKRPRAQANPGGVARLATPAHIRTATRASHGPSTCGRTCACILRSDPTSVTCVRWRSRVCTTGTGTPSCIRASSRSSALIVIISLFDRMHCAAIWDEGAGLVVDRRRRLWLLKEGRRKDKEELPSKLDPRMQASVSNKPREEPRLPAAAALAAASRATRA